MDRNTNGTKFMRPAPPALLEGDRFEVEVIKKNGNYSSVRAVLNGYECLGVLYVKQRVEEDRFPFASNFQRRYVDDYQTSPWPMQVDSQQLWPQVDDQRFNVNNQSNNFSVRRMPRQTVEAPLRPNIDVDIQRFIERERERANIARQQPQQQRVAQGTQIIRNDELTDSSSSITTPTVSLPKKNKRKSFIPREAHNILMPAGVDPYDDEPLMDYNLDGLQPGPSGSGMQNWTSSVLPECARKNVKPASNDVITPEVLTNYIMQNEVSPMLDTAMFLATRNTSTPEDQFLLESVMQEYKQKSGLPSLPKTKLPGGIVNASNGVHKKKLVASPRINQGGENGPINGTRNTLPRLEPKVNGVTAVGTANPVNVTPLNITSEFSKPTATPEEPTVHVVPPIVSDDELEGLENMSGAERLATLAGCPNLAEAARKAAQTTKKMAVKEPDVPEKPSPSATPSIAAEKPGEKDGGGKKDDRRIVLKVSLKDLKSQSVVDSKPSPVSSTSSISTRRTIADLRCPPEIAKSFEDQQRIVRRSDTGCPPMMPRSGRVEAFEEDEAADEGEEEEKPKRKRVSAGRKKQLKPIEEPAPAQEAPVEETAQEPEETTTGPSVLPAKEENPFDLGIDDIVWAKCGSEPYWPGKLYNFVCKNGVVTAMIVWYGVETYSPNISLSKVEPFAVNYNKRFNPKRNDRKYHKGVARAIAACRPLLGYFENNISKWVHDDLVNVYKFELGKFETTTKKRKRRSGGAALKKKKLAPPSTDEKPIDGIADGLQDDEYDEDDLSSVDDQNEAPEADGEGRTRGVTASERQVAASDTASSNVSSGKSEDSGRTSPRSPIL